jgi:superfamily II RNA helicase
MLPAIGFVFSRKLVELCASEITVPLLEDDSKVGYNVRRECEQIVRRLPNAHEYLELPEYHQVVGLLEKGIGIHHSGMIPVLREIVELMITKKYIKFLFATESFAIGLDCPIKTAAFINLSKFDGHTERYLMSHEYTQMAGRAGRRGIDTIGYVVHCNNLFPFLTKTDYQAILCGKPQDLVSKFRISYSVVLNLVKNGRVLLSDFVQFVEKSMISQELAKEKADATKSLENLSEMYKRSAGIIDRLQTPLEACNSYLETEESLKTAVNKKRKELERKMGSFVDQYRYIKTDVHQVRSFNQLKMDYEREYRTAEHIDTYIERNVENLCSVLVKQCFLSRDESGVFGFTDKGSIASNIHEIHSLIFAQFMNDQHDFSSYSPEQLIGLLACFTDVKVDEDCRNWYVTSEDAVLKAQLLKLHALFDRYETIEFDENVNTGFDYKSALNYDMTDFAMEWAKCENEEECKYFIQSRLQEKGISVGDFVKAILKISTIVNELSSVAEEYGKIELLNKLSKIDGLILKYVTMSQSLYV